MPHTKDTVANFRNINENKMLTLDSDAAGHSSSLAPTTTRPSEKKRGRRAKVEHHFPVPPTIIQVVKKPRTFTNHSYRDFSNVPVEGNESKKPPSIDDMCFAEKVHDILSQQEYNNYISWMPHGRAFRVSKCLCGSLSDSHGYRSVLFVCSQPCLPPLKKKYVKRILDISATQVF
jgi:hypothetical protein